MLLLYIIILIIALYMFGPALVSAVGALLSGVFFVVTIIITAPAVLLVAHRNMKTSDRIYDEMQDAKSRGGAPHLRCFLKKYLHLDKIFVFLQ